MKTLNVNFYVDDKLVGNNFLGEIDGKNIRLFKLPKEIEKYIGSGKDVTYSPCLNEDKTKIIGLTLRLDNVKIEIK